MGLGDIKTPCIGVCSTVFGGNVCRGCKRFAHEVIDWNAYSSQQKVLIWNRLDSLTEQVMSQRIVVEDAQQLAAELEHQKIRFNRNLSPYCWALELIRAIGNQPYPLEQAGVRLLPRYREENLKILLEDVNKDLIALSEAWYDASFSRAHRFRQIARIAAGEEPDSP